MVRIVTPASMNTSGRDHRKGSTSDNVREHYETFPWISEGKAAKQNENKTIRPGRGRILPAVEHVPEAVSPASTIFEASTGDEGDCDGAQEEKPGQSTITSKNQVQMQLSFDLNAAVKTIYSVFFAP